MTVAIPHTPKKVEVHSDPEGLTVVYHWRNWIFGIFVLMGLILTGVSLSVLLMAVNRVSSSIIMMILPLCAIGPGMLYWSLGKMINRTEIVIRQDQLISRHKPLPWRGNVTLATHDIKKVSVTHSYQENATRYRLIAFTREGREWRLIPNIDHADAAAYMEQEIEAYLGLGKPLNPAEQEATLAKLEQVLAKFEQVASRTGLEQKLGGFGLLLLLLLIVGFLLVHGLAVSVESRAAMSWPAVQGQVVSGSVHTTSSYDSSTKRTTYSYHPEITYRYSVNDQGYTSTRISFGGESYSSDAAARQVVQAYLNQPTVPVYYNPQDPGRSVLNRSVSDWELIAGLVIGNAMLVGSLIYFYFIRRRYAKEYGQAPGWHEIFPWLKVIPGGRR